MPATAQTTDYLLQEGYDLKIEGTSNVRDWDAVAESMEGILKLRNFEGMDLSDLTADRFESLEIRIPVDDLQSDGRRLTNNVHDYLEKDDHPVITFRLQEITGLEQSEGNAEAVLTANGTIRAAGNDHTTDLQVHVQSTPDNGLRFFGSRELKMTDFDIDPPRAMMGTIRAVDELTVHFDVTFKPES